jgi:hypothetical protein
LCACQGGYQVQDQRRNYRADPQALRFDSETTPRRAGSEVMRREPDDGRAPTVPRRRSARGACVRISFSQRLEHALKIRSSPAFARRSPIPTRCRSRGHHRLAERVRGPRDQPVLDDPRQRRPWNRSTWSSRAVTRSIHRGHIRRSCSSAAELTASGESAPAGSSDPSSWSTGPYWPSLSLRIIATDSLLGASLHLRPATIAALRHRASRPSARRCEGRTRTAARARRDP